MMNLLSTVYKADVLDALDILWKGLVAVFLVILIVFIVVILLNLISAKSAKYKQAHAGEPTVSDKIKAKWEASSQAREDKKAAKLLEKEAKKQEKLEKKQQDEQDK